MSDSDPKGKRLCTITRNVISHAFLWVDPAGVIRDCNIGFERIFGYSYDEIVGKPVAILFVEQDQVNKQHWQELLTARQDGMSGDDRWHVKKDGSLFWAVGVVEPIRDGSGEVSGYIKMIRDLTTDKLLHEELLRSNRQLQEFAFIAAHDIQSPLNKINGFAELLLQHHHRLPEKVNSYIARIRASAEQMRTVIDGVLRFARIQDSEIGFEKVDLNEVIQSVMGELDSLIKESAGRVISSTLPALSARPSQMYQLFMNLIGNGLKYGGNPPEVRVSATEGPDSWRFEVRDNGAGIPDKERMNVFKLFYRAGLNGKATGAGIGLAICKNIVEQHSGRIWIDSPPGGGTMFCFTLPIQRSSPRTEEKPLSIFTNKSRVRPVARETSGKST